MVLAAFYRTQDLENCVMKNLWVSHDITKSIEVIGKQDKNQHLGESAKLWKAFCFRNVKIKKLFMVSQANLNFLHFSEVHKSPFYKSIPFGSSLQNSEDFFSAFSTLCCWLVTISQMNNYKLLWGAKNIMNMQYV